MSTSYGSSLIVGIPLNEIYQPEVREDDKIKYHEDTGKPYTVKVKRLYANFGNKVLPPVDFKIDDYSSFARRENVYQDWDFLGAEGINLHMSCGYSETEWLMKYALVGIEVTTCDQTSLGIVPFADLNMAADKVRAALTKFGYTGDIRVCTQLQWG